ncbi:MAG: Tol-Pal system beta propeller repeat protein TolB [Gammaproteobacteria bacterium]|nr:Tol-Pal system beta propeller repeat protein TolB [Gammaproteobacteria bacterium]
MTVKKIVFSFLSICLLLLSHSAYAVLEIEITQGTVGALPIAVVPFKSEQNLDNVAAIVSNDLNRSGVFTALKLAELPAKPHFSKQVNYAQWREAGIEYLVVGRIIERSSNMVDVQFQLLSVLKQKQMLGYSLPVKTNKVRASAHKISDLIYEKITGIQGAFDTRIAYVNALKDKARKYILQVADTDGFNPQTVLESDHPLMSPSWSPNGESLAYVSFENKRPEIYIQHLATAIRSKVTGFKGLNSAPSWSPDGKKMALVLSKGGSPDIYVFNIGNKRLKRLTTHRAIDTEPVWMPDGKSIVFTSDRGGSPQLYKVDVNGSRPQRLTFEGSYNSAATVSPDGKFLAMVFQQQGKYNIAMLELETKQLSILTDTQLDESPSFSPNGKMILYASTRLDKGVLYAISVDGRSKHKLSDQTGDIREPVWGPFKRKKQ